MKFPRAVRFAALSFLSAFLFACDSIPDVEFDQGALGSDGGSITIDAAPDVVDTSVDEKVDAAADASGKGPFKCGSTLVDECADCPNAKALCTARKECVAVCSDCDNAVPCIYCEKPSKPYAVCVPAVSPITCNENLRCKCTTHANCPGTATSLQTCVAGECRTCGEPTTQGANCAKGGPKDGTCETQPAPRCK